MPDVVKLVVMAEVVALLNANASAIAATVRAVAFIAHAAAPVETLWEAAFRQFFMFSEGSG